MKVRSITLVGIMVFGILAIICFSGALYMFLSTFYFGSDKSVKTWKDPRWRVFDYNSRQAAENEIYNVAEIPALKGVREVSKRKLRFEFTPEIPASSWKILSKKSGDIISQGQYPDISFSEKAYNDTYLFIPEGIDLLRDIAITINYAPTESYQKHDLSLGILHVPQELH